MNATALIAEDEPLLAANMQAELAHLWPELRIIASVNDGEAAVKYGLTLQPDLMFLDIRMPGLTGIEAAKALAEDWPDSGKAFPLIVFVTAYDLYALQAFEHAAIDYVLKPVRSDRLAQTCERVQTMLRLRTQPPTGEPAINAVIDQLRGLLDTGSLGSTSASPAAMPLRMIQAVSGNTITMVPVDNVLYFEAADKYVRVVTAEREHLIRISMRELGPQLDMQRFWQIHRGTIVHIDAIASALRDDTGKLKLTLRGHRDTLNVSRLYAHLFKGM